MLSAVNIEHTQQLYERKPAKKLAGKNTTFSDMQLLMAKYLKKFYF
jgi:hypothetical protein